LISAPLAASAGAHRPTLCLSMYAVKSFSESDARSGDVLTSSAHCAARGGPVGGRWGTAITTVLGGERGIGSGRGRPIPATARVTNIIRVVFCNVRLHLRGKVL
jgi:hypothetical protein